MAPVPTVQNTDAATPPAATPLAHPYKTDTHAQCVKAFLRVCSPEVWTLFLGLFRGDARLVSAERKLDSPAYKPLIEDAKKFFKRSGFENTEDLSGSDFDKLTAVWMHEATAVRDSPNGKKVITAVSPFFKASGGAAVSTTSTDDTALEVSRSLVMHSDDELLVAGCFRGADNDLSPDRMDTLLEMFRAAKGNIKDLAERCGRPNSPEINAALLANARKMASDGTLNVKAVLDQLALAASATPAAAKPSVVTPPIDISALAQDVGRRVSERYPTLREKVGERRFWSFVHASSNAVYGRSIENTGGAKGSEVYTLKVNQAVEYTVFLCGVALGTNVGGLFLVNEGETLLNIVRTHVLTSTDRFMQILTALVGAFPYAKPEDLGLVANLLNGCLVRLEVETSYIHARIYGNVTKCLHNDYLSCPNSLQNISAEYGLSALLLIKSIISCGLFLHAHGSASIVYVASNFLQDFGVNFSLVETFICGGLNPQITQFALSVYKDSGLNHNAPKAADLIPDVKLLYDWTFHAGKVGYYCYNNNPAHKTRYDGERASASPDAGLPALAALLGIKTSSHQEAAGTRRAREEPVAVATGAATAGRSSQGPWYCPFHQRNTYHTPEECTHPNATHPEAKRPANSAAAKSGTAAGTPAAKSDQKSSNKKEQKRR